MAPRRRPESVVHEMATTNAKLSMLSSLAPLQRPRYASGVCRTMNHVSERLFGTRIMYGRSEPELANRMTLPLDLGEDLEAMELVDLVWRRPRPGVAATTLDDSVRRD